MTCTAEHVCTVAHHATANHAPLAVVLIAAVGLPMLTVLLFYLGARLSTERS